MASCISFAVQRTEQPVAASSRRYFPRLDIVHRIAAERHVGTSLRRARDRRKRTRRSAGPRWLYESGRGAQSLAQQGTLRGPSDVASDYPVEQSESFIPKKSAFSVS